MPDNSSGIYTLPPSYLAVVGQPILASQHNPALEDIQAGLTARLSKDGRAPMTGLLTLSGDAVNPLNPVTKQQFDILSAVATTQASIAAASAAQAAALAGPGYGINIGSAIEHTASFTVTSSDMGILHVLKPAINTVLQVTMPPANANVGKGIAFMVPAGIDGKVRFMVTAGQATSLISDYSNDDVYMWTGEILTLLSVNTRWEILDFKRNPFMIECSMTTGADIAMAGNGQQELNGWGTPTGLDGTWKRHYRHGLDGGTPQRVIAPRRGLYNIELDLTVDWQVGGAVPLQVSADIFGMTGYNGYINIEPMKVWRTDSSPVKGLVNFKARATPLETGASVKPFIFWNAGTATNIKIPGLPGGAQGSPRLRMTEL